MDVEAKQREWIWEHFLKNCTAPEIIQELMKCYPFPEENPYLQKLLLLRSLSLHVSAGIIDELTLKILGWLGGLPRFLEAAKVFSANCSLPASVRKRKVPDNAREGEISHATSALNITSSQAKGMGIETRKDISNDDGKAEAIFGIRDWMKGRALPRALAGSGSGEEQVKEKDFTSMNNESTTSCLKNFLRGDFHFTVGQSSKQWDIELAVMAELAVKHLRGDPPDKASFEQALSKYWNDSKVDTEICTAADGLEFLRARDQIKGELYMVMSKPELLDTVVAKYPKDRLEDMLKTYLEKAWAGTPPTFLEVLCVDVVSGVYKPVNCNYQRQPRKVGVPSEDGELGREGNGMDQTAEKPWIRASRGKYSRSREKLQKKFAIRDLDDDERVGLAAKELAINEEGTASGEANAKAAGRGNEDLDNVTVRRKGRHGGRSRARGSPSSEEQLGTDVNNNGARRFESIVIDGGVARVLEFEEPSLDGTPDGKEKQNGDPEGAEMDAEVLSIENGVRKAEDPIMLTPEGHLPENSTERDPAVGNAGITGGTLDAAGVPLTEVEATRTIDDEQDEEASHANCLGDMPTAELRPPHHEEALDKENVVTPAASPLQRLESNHNPSCFNRPPWVAGSPAGLVTEGKSPGLTRRKKSGSITDDASTASVGPEEALIGREDEKENHRNRSAEAETPRRVLRREKVRMTGAIEQTSTLPTILTTAKVSSSLLERNRTAQTLEWEEDDDIEESQPNSPSASRRARLPQPISGHVSPLVGGTQSTPSNGTNAAAGQGRRKRRKWSEREVDILRTEVSKYGKGRWKLILEKNVETFRNRTEVDLKDKWRNLERFEGITE